MDFSLLVSSEISILEYKFKLKAFVLLNVYKQVGLSFWYAKSSLGKSHSAQIICSPSTHRFRRKKVFLKI